MIMGKRCLAMVVYDPTKAAGAAGEDEQRAAKRARPSPGEGEAGAVVPYNAAPAAGQPVEDAQPLNAVPWQLQLQPQPLTPVPSPLLSAMKHEPPCLRSHILHVLRLRADLDMHFIDVKTVTSTDLDAHQNRFRIPTFGVLHRLRPLLTHDELDAANLLYDPEPRARAPKQLPAPPAETSSAAAGPSSSSSEKQPPEGEKVKKKKKKGRVHGGLPVRLVDLAAGASLDLRLSRWESSHGTIVKGELYLDFIRRCSFKEKDEVEIWAFKQRAFRNFGVTMCDESVLHLFIVKKDSAPATCRYCPPLPSPVNESSDN